MKPISVAVFPAEKADEFVWIFSNLEQIFPVRFVKADVSSFPDSQYGVAFQSSTTLTGNYPPGCLVYVQSGTPSSPISQQIHFHDSPLLDERIRHRTMAEKSLSSLGHLDISGEILATVDGRAVWVYKGDSSQIDIVSLPAVITVKKRLLADNIQEHRFYFLMTLIHFLYRVLKGSGWVPPPLRATFIIDDPNLRRETYGYFDSRKIVELARKHNFHLSVATPPADFDIASAGVVNLFRENARFLSLSIHGNNHTHRELGRPYTDDEARSLVCEMLGRVVMFEQEHGLKVARVVVSPNEMCSQQMLRMMQHFDIDAVTASRPKPWLSTDTWEEGIEEGDSLLCSYPGEFTEGFMSVIRRSRILGNLVYRAFLNQPVILYYHHTDFANGLENLLNAAGMVNSLGHVQWQSIGEISRSNYEMRYNGDTVIVRPFSRCVLIPMPQNVSQLTVNLPVTVRASELVCSVNGSVYDFDKSGLSIEEIPIGGGDAVEVRLLSSLQKNFNNGKPRRKDILTWVRRRGAELRDRAKPHIRLPRI